MAKQYVVTPSQMKKAEAMCEQKGTSCAVLMRNVGSAIALHISRIVKPCRAAVLVGSGNNGGDGVACARFLKERGCEVRAFLCGNEEKCTADTREMISVDMGCVGDDLGCTERMVSICAKDSGGPYNYDLVTTLSNIARELELDYAIDVYPHYGSDVEATLSAGYDIRHGLIGPGVYASHNYERSHIDGVRNTYELVRAYVQR